MIPNARLEALAAPLLAQAQAQHAASGQKMRLVAETIYQARSWNYPRRAVYKAAAHAAGANTRFVVTTRPDPPDLL